MLEIEKGVDTHEIQETFDDYADQSAGWKLSDHTRTGGRSKRRKCRDLRNFRKRKRIDEYAFANSTSLVSVKIPDSVTAIGDYAFSAARA